METNGVSILCNTFNHEDYIAKALDCFLMQQTTFDYEILIHDDASSDNTAKIIKQYEEKYPDKVKPIYQTENQYSKNININHTFQYPRAKGKYIAVCEGDDFWTESDKLQKQFVALEVNTDVNMCSHKAEMVNAITGKKIGVVAPSKKTRILSVNEVIKGGGAYLATNSLFYRKKLIYNVPTFRTILPLDYTLQIYGALDNGILYLNENLSAYRTETPNSWTDRAKNNYNFKLSHSKKTRAMFEQLDRDTNKKYHTAIKYVYIRSLLKDIYYMIMRSLKQNGRSE